MDDFKNNILGLELDDFRVSQVESSEREGSRDLIPVQFGLGFGCGGCVRCAGCAGCGGCFRCAGCAGCGGCFRCAGCAGCGGCVRCGGCAGCGGCARCGGCAGPR